MDISKWIKARIDNLHTFERCELASPTIPRDEAVGAWIIRCLANPDCEDSAEMLSAIEKRRIKVTKHAEKPAAESTIE
jgi:hypothetical protein